MELGAFRVCRPHTQSLRPSPPAVRSLACPPGGATIGAPLSAVRQGGHCPLSVAPRTHRSLPRDPTEVPAVIVPSSQQEIRRGAQLVVHFELSIWPLYAHPHQNAAIYRDL